MARGSSLENDAFNIAEVDRIAGGADPGPHWDLGREFGYLILAYQEKIRAVAGNLDCRLLGNRQARPEGPHYQC